MSIDYKYANKDYDRGPHWPRRFLFLLILVFLISATVYGIYFFQARSVNEQILTGNYTQARETLDHWLWLPMVSARTYERVATAELLANGKEASASYFQKAEKRLFFRPVSFWEEVLKILWNQGRYEDGLAYADHIVAALPDEKVLHFYRAGFLGGIHQAEKALKELSLAGDIPEFRKEIETLKTELERLKTRGDYVLLYDRENLPLVNVNTESEISPVYKPAMPVLVTSRMNVPDTIRQMPYRQASLTIDSRIQNAAIQALGQYAGSIVVLDARSGQILAAASNPKGVRSDHPENAPLAFDEMYEPGSIIKMITLAGALEKGVDLSSIFPFECTGLLKLSNNKILYDWKVHGTVTGIDQATAVSCNVSFAKLGLAMKPAEFLENLRNFGFDSRVEHGIVSMDLGKILDDDISDFYLSHLSIGLEYLKMTPLHAALLAAGIANGGIAQTPQLLLHFRNIIGVPFSIPEPITYRKFMSEATSKKITAAMQQVILSDEGTGRRAAIDGFPFAMKTGTAGEGAVGYNALLIGFGPVPVPKIAFSIFIEHCGKAEFEGARITKLFLESVRNYI